MNRQVSLSRIIIHAALPLVLWGWLPFWAVLLLCLLFAVTARREEWEMYRLLGGALLVGFSFWPLLEAQFSAGGWLPDWWLALLLFLRLVALWLACRAAELLADEGGSSRSETLRGWVFLLLPLLLAPHPVGLLGLVAGALLRPGHERTLARAGRPFRPVQSSSEPSRGQSFWQTRWGQGALPLAAVLLIALLLPRTSLLGQVDGRVAASLETIQAETVG
ncbi:hypothetical protein [Deinococcus sp. Marseille-Q6407]|uniref:hypothetical protein n=1 Tax=Deinococcus sp. Marseille-Q6407 TaxID=2969223 RepID=UPI0021C15EBB|nr:hypothetical protein [Deinococcus sp. Marseille-Q6407]